jgi:hypothetical protein
MKKLFSQGLMLATLLSLSLPLGAQAQNAMQTDNPMVSSQEVVMGPFNNNANLEVPQLVIIPGSNLELHLLNPSPSPLTFSSPDLHLSYTVPANSERVIYVGPETTANLTSGQQVAYYIVDSSGNQLASSTIVNSPTIASSINTDTTVASEYQQTETTASQQTNVEKRSTVRGYW